MKLSEISTNVRITNKNGLSTHGHTTVALCYSGPYMTVVTMEVFLGACEAALPDAP